MAETTELRLPSSSLDELWRIIKGYANMQSEAGAADVAKLLGMQRTIVSANNGFLVDTGIISSGQKKAAMDVGRRLGRALDHGQIEDARVAAREVVSRNNFLANLVTHVRLKGSSGVKSEDLAKQVLYVSGQRPTGSNRTGARTIVELLKFSGLLTEEDDRLNVAAPTFETKSAENQSVEVPFNQGPNGESVGTSTATPGTKQVPEFVSTNRGPSVTISIQLQLPETEKAEVYENLFKALREHLFPHEP